MASNQQTILFAPTALTATTNGTGVVLVPRSKRIIGRLVVTGPSGTVVVTAKVQHSPDNLVWTDYLAFTATAAGATADEIKYPTNDPILPYARAVFTLSGAVQTCTAAMYLYSETYAQ